MTDLDDLPEDADTDPRERDLADRSSFAFCPYCAADVEIILDPGGASTQHYVEDCEVCCRPWTVRVRWVDGHANIELRTEDEV